MTSTVKNQLSTSHRRSILRTMRNSSPSQSQFSTLHAILPSLVPSSSSKRSATKKRVRFALSLEPIEEDPPSSPPQPCTSAEVKLKRRVVDPWREENPLYHTYLAYLQRQGLPPPPTDLYPSKRAPVPSSPSPESDLSSSSFPTMAGKLSDSPSLELANISPSPTHLPRIIDRTKKTREKRPLQPAPKHRHSPENSTPPLSSKKVPNLLTQRTANLSMKRTDTGLPSMNSSTTIERIPSETSASKRFNEVLMHPLPTVNSSSHQKKSERTHLPNLSKKTRSPSASQRRPTDELYFFQTHTRDRFSPVIHSTH